MQKNGLVNVDFNLSDYRNSFDKQIKHMEKQIASVFCIPSWWLIDTRQLDRKVEGVNNMPKFVIRSGNGYLISLCDKTPQMSSEKKEATLLDENDAVKLRSDLISCGYQAEVIMI